MIHLTVNLIKDYYIFYTSNSFKLLFRPLEKEGPEQPSPRD
jgi:hypothetical protein